MHRIAGRCTAFYKRSCTDSSVRKDNSPRENYSTNPGTRSNWGSPYNQQHIYHKRYRKTEHCKRICTCRRYQQRHTTSQRRCNTYERRRKRTSPAAHCGSSPLRTPYTHSRVGLTKFLVGRHSFLYQWRKSRTQVDTSCCTHH